MTERVKRLVRYGALAIVASALLWALWPRGIAQVQCQGQTLRVPIPYFGIQFDAAECRSVYFVPGEHDLSKLYIERGAALGWRFVDQAGGGLSIESIEPELWHVTVLFEPRSQLFTQIELRARRP